MQRDRGHLVGMGLQVQVEVRVHGDIVVDMMNSCRINRTHGEDKVVPLCLDGVPFPCLLAPPTPHTMPHPLPSMDPLVMIISHFPLPLPLTTPTETTRLTNMISDQKGTATTTTNTDATI